MNVRLREVLVRGGNALDRLEKLFSKAERERAKAEAELISWRSAFQSATPGGSEFMSPKEVRDWVDRRREEYHKAKVAETLMRRERDEAVKALANAEEWFRDYERQHLAKNTADGDAKAATNLKRADYLKEVRMRISKENTDNAD